MPRHEREKYTFATYHIIQRGNEKQRIFLSDNDMYQFLSLLKKTKQKYNYLLYAYCLMSNHVHLMLNDNGQDISLIMRSLNTSYAVYFNRKYQRSGHLFQDRFKSELVTDDTYLLELSRYIHNNPVKACLVNDPADYPWSSYGHYIGQINNNDLIDRDFILSMFSQHSNQAKGLYRNFVVQRDDTGKAFMDIYDDQEIEESDSKKLAYEHEFAQQLLRKKAASRQLSIEQVLLNQHHRNEVIWELKQQTSLSLKEIGQICGNISASRVSRILNSHQVRNFGDGS